MPAARPSIGFSSRRREEIARFATEPLGRSVTALLPTLQELEHLGAGFVSLTEALDLTTPAGRLTTGFLAISVRSGRRTMMP